MATLFIIERGVFVSNSYNLMIVPLNYYPTYQKEHLFVHILFFTTFAAKMY